MPADSYGGIVSTRELLRSPIQTSRCCDLRSAEESSCFDGPAGRWGRLASNQNAIREEIMLRDATVTRNSIDAGRSDVTSRDPDGERRAPRRHDRHRAPPCGGGTLRSNMDPCSGSEHLAAPISALWPPLD